MLSFWKSEPQYTYKRYAYKKKTCNAISEVSLIELFALRLPTQ